MKNNIADLNNYLFEQLERLQDDNMSDQDLRREIARSRAVTEVASVIVGTGTLALRAAKAAGNQLDCDNTKIPGFLEAK